MMDRKMMEMLYDLKRGMLRPAYDRLAVADKIRRDPDTYEISWEPTSIEQKLREAGLI
jgi:hypothetical protein